MRIPRIKGVIKRRILANYRADPEYARKLLPAVFRPKLHGGHAIVGVCLIRLEKSADVRHFESRFYADKGRFPHGTLKFDNALLMEDIEHEWRSTADMRLMKLRKE